MSATHRAITAALVLSVVGWHFLPINSIGFGYYQNTDGTEVSAGTHPAALVWAALVICLYVFLMKKQTHANSAGHAGLIRRFFAYVIDLLVVIGATSCIAALIPLGMEAHRVGHFEWSFQRNYTVSSDATVISPLVVLSFIELFFYFAYPLTKGTQTIGEYIMRIKVAPSSGVEGRFTWGEAMTRIFYSAGGFCLWPYTIWTRLDRNGQTWYDRRTNCRASLVVYK
jgi:hypothetical protein